MNRPTLIPHHVWDSLSDEARVVIGFVVEGLERRVAELEQQVRDLTARVAQNSTNSSKPPPSDPIGVKRKPPVPPSKKRRGGQKGTSPRMASAPIRA